MQDTKSTLRLIEQLLATRVKNRDFANAHHRLAYERGFLTGLLANIAHNDSAVKTMIDRHIENIRTNSR